MRISSGFFKSFGLSSRSHLSISVNSALTPFLTSYSLHVRIYVTTYPLFKQIKNLNSGSSSHRATYVTVLLRLGNAVMLNEIVSPVLSYSLVL